MIHNIFKRVFILLIFIGIFLNGSEKLPLNYLDKKQTQLDITVSLISAMSETVHSLQQERGASCGYVSSQGTKFEEKLSSIKIKSDRQISDLHHILDKNHNLLKKYISDKQHNTLDKTFETIYTIRKNVKNLKIDFSKTYSKYTQSIAFILLNISNISDLLENKELNDKLYIYSTLLMHKESIGQKRAALSSLFSKKDFAKEIFEYFLTADTQEKIYLKSFLHIVDNNIKKLYVNTINDNSIKIVNEYEKLALEKLSGKIIDVNSQIWFTNITRKIDLIQKIEHKIFNDILLIVHKINTNSSITLTKDEKEWLEQNNIIKIAVMNYWTHDSNGNSLHTDILKLLNKYGNINIIPVKYDTWKDGFGGASNGINIHGIMNLSWSKIREEKYFNYTTAYNYAPNYLVTKKYNNNIHSLSDLKNKSIYLKTKAITHLIVKNISKDINIIDVKSDSKMYESLAKSKNAEAFLSYSIDKDKLEQYNLKVVKTIYDKTGEVAIGINKKYPELATILNKIYKIIPKELLESLRNKKYSSDKKITINLTDDEKKWIKTHTVKIGVEQWSPVIFSNNGKDIDGICGDFTKKIVENTGLKIKVINNNWNKLLVDFKNKDLDLLPATYYTDKRSKFGLYSDAYFKMRDSIYIKKSNNQIFSLKDLEGKTLAIPKGYGTIDKLQKKFPKITLVFTKDLDDSIDRVLNGRVTAFYEGQIAAEAKIKSELIDGLKSISIKTFKAPTLHYFSRIGEPLLQSIIQKGLKLLTYQERDTIISKWVTSNNILKLTNNERKWLDKEQPITYVYDPDWAPFEWTNELEQHTGIIADILQLVSQTTGIKFIPINTKNWSDSVKKMETQSVNMYSAVVENEKRQKYAQFTSKNIYSSPGVIVSRTDDDTVYVDIKTALKEKTVGVVKGNAIFDYMKKTYPRLNFLTVDSTQDGFEKLQNKQIDIFILNAATAQYFIKQKGYRDTRIATKVDFSFDLKIAIQKNMPQEVLSILDKAIDNISEKELGDIYYKWTHLSVQKKTDWVLIGQISSGIILLILFILWNNYKLKSKVEEKTKDLQDVLDSMEVTINERTEELNDEKNFINSVINSQENFVITSDGKCLKTANNAFLKFFKVKNTIEFIEKYGDCICDTFDINAPKEYIQKMMDNEKWLDYIYNRPEEIHKAIIQQNRQEYIFTITADNLIFKGEELRTAVFTDVTTMEKQKSHLQKFFNNNGAGILIVNKNRNIIEVNPKFCDIWGCSQNEIIGHNTQDLHISKESYQKFGQIAFKQVKQTKSVEIEYQFKKIDGSIFWARFSGEPLSSNGDVLWVINDITLIKEAQEELNNEKRLIDSIMDSQENIVITSTGKTFKAVNKAFLEFFKVNNSDEFIKLFGNCICDAFDKSSSKEYLKKDMDGIKWIDYIFNNPNKVHKVVMNQDDIKHIFTVSVDSFKFGDENLITIVFTDITNMEKVKNEMEQILSNILLPVLITSKKRRKIMYANKYAEIQYEASVNEIIGSNIDEVYTIGGGPEPIIKELSKKGYVENLEQNFRTRTNKEFTALLSVTPITYQDEEAYIGMVTDITKQKKMENEVRAIHKHTKDSIEYASLIQGALIPNKSLFDNYFKDSFIIWTPKDIVGGDIYLFEELRDKNECLLMCIDCTGHGVPGAFVTMLVKAIERQIIAKIEHDKYHDIDISPAWILAYFNRKMKQLLKQDNEKSLSNAGFDGGIIYYNKKDKILKFSGAETPLFYFNKDGEFKTIKGSRHSVGYKKCNINFEYKEHIIEVDDGMKFYIATDGYLDQNGGEKDFPFGKKRFINIIKENINKPMAELQTALLSNLMDYESMVENNERNDDITVIGFEIKDDGISTILEYDGELTQGIITHTIQTLENKITNINMLSKVSTIAIELTQNMMNYSKSYDEDCLKIVPAGYIEVLKDKHNKYYVKSRNIISAQDKDKIEPKLLEIQSLDADALKKRYRELRRSGQNTHDKGGGIGFYEIAKLSRDIDFSFKSINKDKYQFKFNITVERRLKDR